MGKSDIEFSDFNKVCRTLNAFTKMDVRLIDENGRGILQLVNHIIPASLKNPLNEFEIINETLRNNFPNSYYYHINSYGLEYIASGIWRNNRLYSFILIGPFLSSVPTVDFISGIISVNKLPVSERKQLHEFYESLSVRSGNDFHYIGDLLVNMCAHKPIDSQLITSDILKPALNKKQLQADIAESQDIIELRYSYEKKLMNAIAKGDKDEVARLFQENSDVLNISDRIPESPIRSVKNISLVLNTVCRIAIERGGVHPVYVHTISEKFAILIERAPNLPYLKKLSIVMINEYCDLVKQFSTRQYSPIVKRAIDYINLNLGSSLSLQAMAGEMHVNPSHLSRKFKTETNMSIIDFIHEKRVEEAKLYLQKGNIPITEIALMVGFNDLNYFTRVFKKFTSITPSQYIKSKAFKHGSF